MTGISSNNWQAVDHYLEAHLLSNENRMNTVLKHNVDEGLPAIDVSPLQGKFST